jgi:hypothetical protein
MSLRTGQAFEQIGAVRLAGDINELVPACGLRGHESNDWLASAGAPSGAGMIVASAPVRQWPPGVWLTRSLGTLAGHYAR